MSVMTLLAAVAATLTVGQGQVLRIDVADESGLEKISAK